MKSTMKVFLVVFAIVEEADKGKVRRGHGDRNGGFLGLNEKMSGKIRNN